MARPPDPSGPSVAALLLGAYALVVAARHAPGLHWSLEVLGNFGVHLALGGLALAVALLLDRRPAFAAAAVLAAAVAATPALRLYGADAGPRSTRDPVRLSLHNVLSSNPTPQRAIDEMVALDGEIVVVLETTDAWTPRLQALKSRLPFQSHVPRDDNFGVAVLSAHPLRNLTRVMLGRPDGARVPALRFDVAVSWGTLQVVAVHLFPPMGARGARMRGHQAQQLATLLGEVDRPTVVLGDFNTGPTTRTHRRLAAAATGLRSARWSFGLLGTWPAGMPAPLRIPIDDVLVSPQLTVLDLGLGGETGSDHRAMWVEVAPRGTPALAPKPSPRNVDPPDTPPSSQESP